MRLNQTRLAPILIASAVILVVCLLQSLRLEVLERPELMTYDWRARLAARFHPLVCTNLGFAAIDEPTIEFVLTNQTLGYNCGLYWPRHVYGRVVSELTAQGATAIAFDVIFAELRPDHTPVLLPDGTTTGPDEFFARQLARAGNVILSSTPFKPAPPLFLTNAAALGDIQTKKDFDGILRRAKAFRAYRRWHPLFTQMAADPGFAVDLDEAWEVTNTIVLPRRIPPGADVKPEDRIISVPLDRMGNFDLTGFLGDQLPAGMARWARPYTEERIWHLGIQLAARELHLDLAGAEVDLAAGRITLRGPAGVRRDIPVDAQGYFYVDWALPADSPTLVRQSVMDLLVQEHRRQAGETNGLDQRWRGKLAVIGSRAVGNDLNDLGATPLQSDTWLVSKHWNVANSLITGRFVARAGPAVELGSIILLGALTTLVLMSGLRAVPAFGVALLIWTAWLGLAIGVFLHSRYWLPIFAPITGAGLVNYTFLLVHHIVFEQAEGRRIKSIFSNMVSPKIVTELLAQPKLGLGGSRREITVLFADVRGFTEFTDASQKFIASYIAERGLTGAEAEAAYDRQAGETLHTVNTYLGLIANTIIENDGTFDKFIGDCVMAFWGAPVDSPKHALQCVRAAIGGQRAIHELNRRRAAENDRRVVENETRRVNGEEPLSMLAVLSLGTGINTGPATAGLMGSELNSQYSYTVFGREVNLASRLEGASGRGRIFISETTHAHLLRDDPALAATCVPQPEPLKLKGFSAPVRVYEVPWHTPAEPLLDAEKLPERPDTTAFFPRPPRPPAAQPSPPPPT